MLNKIFELFYEAQKSAVNRESLLMTGLEICETLLEKPVDDGTKKIVLQNRGFYLPTLAAIVGAQPQFTQLNPIVRPYWSKHNPSCALSPDNGDVVFSVRSSNYMVRRGNYVENETLSSDYITKNDYYSTKHPKSSEYQALSFRNRWFRAGGRYEGFEDLRLFYRGRSLFAVATELFSSPPRARMCELQIDEDGSVTPFLWLPSFQPIEKNWAPILRNDGDFTGRYVHSFGNGFVKIYSRNGENFVSKAPCRAVNFRGSSQFIHTKEGVLGVVHEVGFTPVENLRVYSHRFVLLDNDSLDVIAMSLPFSFGAPLREGYRGIEYCSGMTIDFYSTVKISFGLADMEAWFCELKFDEVLRSLRPL